MAGSRIPASTAQTLVTTYSTENGWSPDQTRAVWFSTSELADIQALVQQYGGDGARIYFGKYPSDQDIPGIPDPAYKGKVTLVFIPTLATPDGRHQDLFAATTPPTATSGEAYNHGSLCPPNCTEPPPPNS